MCFKVFKYFKGLNAFQNVSICLRVFKGALITLTSWLGSRWDNCSFCGRVARNAYGTHKLQTNVSPFTEGLHGTHAERMIRSTSCSI